MREDKRWRPILGVAVLGLVISSQALYGEKPGRARNSAIQGPRATIGPGIPADLQLPVMPPVKVSYRGQSAQVEGRGKLARIGPRVLPVWEDSEGMDKALTGQVCLIDEQCAVCDQCVLYTCSGTPGKCEFTPSNGQGDLTCDDGLFCNGSENCNAGTCEPGTPPCNGGDVCDDVADACYPACEEFGVDGCNDGDPDTRDTCRPDGVCLHEDIATPGRCCAADGTCSAVTLPECEQASGLFLATADPCVVVEPSGNTNDCPFYSAGIAPQGEWGPNIGPISNLSCDPLSSLGDDYETVDHATLPPDQQFFAVEFIRFVGAVQGYGSTRWSIDFYDANGIFIESTIFPDLLNDTLATLSIRTADFDPPLVIPTKGFVVFNVMANFGLDGRIMMLSTDTVDVGINDSTTMWADDGVVDDILGECAGGDRIGQWCDRRNGNGDCTGGGTCGDIPDVLAFELIGTLATAPLGACCDADEGGCTNRLRWECRAEGNIPQAEGTICGLCPDGMTVCDNDDQCDPPEPDSCDLYENCDFGACCDVATGDCRTVATDTDCDDPDGPGPLAGTEEFLGFGTDCVPNCCEQPLSVWQGADDCSAASLSPHIVNVPPLGSPPVHITITGDNTGATFNEFPDICDSALFDPEGQFKDPGWWEAFSLSACANIRLELCCSDVDGDVWRPAWASLWTACDPCDAPNATQIGVDPPIGLGRGTSGHARGAPYCANDNTWGTFGPLPAGTYYYPMYSAPDGTGASPPGAQYQLNLYAAACPQAACCVGDECQFLNELDCEDAGGYWLLGTVTCGEQSDCDLPDADSPCCTGSCCTGPGQCIDELPSGQPMTEADCDIEGGTYVGGPLCDDDPPPCPVCEIIGGANCQAYDDTALTIMSDRSLPLAGMVIADDFVPQTETLNRVCFWGNYLDGVICAINQGNQAGCGCASEVTDDFLVRVYEDASDLPGALVGESTAAELVRGPVDHLQYGNPADTVWLAARMYEYQMQLADPIGGLIPDRRYWLEISNNTAESDTCYWHWLATSDVRNAYTAVGTNTEPRYARGFERGYTAQGVGGDMGFCVNMNLGTPPTVEAGCCTCPDDGGDCTTEELAACNRGVWDYTNDCGGDCSDAVPVGDTCTDMDIVITDQELVVYPFDTWCADIDGPAQETGEPGVGAFGAGPDIWLHYIAPIDGRFHVNTCLNGNAANTNMDGALAVYWDAVNHTNCVCPGDPNAVRIGTASDEGCNGLGDAGAGLLRPVPVVAAGDCLTVRACGYHDDNAGLGRGTVTIGMEAADCTLTNPPVPDPRVVEFGGNGTRNRYLSFRTSSTGLVEAMKVTFVNLPPPYDGYNDDEWWVGPPEAITEASGSDGIPPNPNPEPHFWLATLQCSGPFYADWTQYDADEDGIPDIIHVYHDGIIPGANYHVQAISDDCNPADPDGYSSPLAVNTSLMGDIVGDCGIRPCGPPQGIIDFVDISACVEKFMNVPPAPQKSRADVIHSNVLAAPPDRKIDFVDISAIVAVFRSEPLPLPGPQVHCP